MPTANNASKGVMRTIDAYCPRQEKMPELVQAALELQEEDRYCWPCIRETLYAASEEMPASEFKATVKSICKKRSAMAGLSDAAWGCSDSKEFSCCCKEVDAPSGCKQGGRHTFFSQSRQNEDLPDLGWCCKIRHGNCDTFRGYKKPILEIPFQANKPKWCALESGDFSLTKYGRAMQMLQDKLKNATLQWHEDQDIEEQDEDINMLPSHMVPVPGSRQ